MTSKLRLAISGGGTAGHVYPALAVLDTWRAGGTETPDVLWIGSTGGMEGGIVAGKGIAFAGVAAGALRGKRPVEVLASTARLGYGFVEALQVLRDFRADVVLTTGGYVCVPVAMAAAALRVPLLVFVPDVKPGLAIRAQRRFARRFAIAFEAAQGYLPGAKTVVTGYPVRPSLLAADRDEARARFGLAATPPVLLLYGGSRGARTLNEALVEALPALLKRCQLLHVSGTLDHADVRRRTAGLTGEAAERYHLFDFLGDRLVDALAAADICIARAGASTLAELPAVGLPAVVVPGPFSDQDLNAAYLTERGAAVTLTNEAVASGGLGPVVLELLADGAARARMAQASRELARPDAATSLITEIRELARR